MEITWALLAALAGVVDSSMFRIYSKEKRVSSKPIVLKAGEHRVELTVHATPGEVKRATELLVEQQLNELDELQGSKNGRRRQARSVQAQS